MGRSGGGGGASIDNNLTIISKSTHDILLHSLRSNDILNSMV